MIDEYTDREELKELIKQFPLKKEAPEEDE